MKLLRMILMALVKGILYPVVALSKPPTLYKGSDGEYFTTSVHQSPHPVLLGNLSTGICRAMVRSRWAGSDGFRQTKIRGESMSLSEYLKYMGYDCTITAMAKVCRVNKSTLHRKYNKNPSSIKKLLERYDDKLRG